MDAKVEIDLNDVALLVRVVQKKTFSAAARERGVPPSTVSRRIARLEAALGIRLLERTTRTLRLTDAGRTYYDHAERAMDDLAQGEGQVQELQREPRGRVRVVAPIALGPAAATVAQSYLHAHPGATLELEFAGRYPDSNDRTFDLALVAGSVEDSSDLIARRVSPPSRKLLFASPAYLEQHGRPLRIEDLARHHCIASRVVDGHATWELRRGRKTRRVTFTPRFYVNAYGAVQRAVLDGLGISVLPESLCTDHVAAKRLVQVLRAWEGQSGGISVVYRAHRAQTAAVRTCIEHFCAELPEIALGKVAQGRPG